MPTHVITTRTRSKFAKTRPRPVCAINGCLEHARLFAHHLTRIGMRYEECLLAMHRAGHVSHHELDPLFKDYMAALDDVLRRAQIRVDVHEMCTRSGDVFSVWRVPIVSDAAVSVAMRGLDASVRPFGASERPTTSIRIAPPRPIPVDLRLSLTRELQVT